MKKIDEYHVLDEDEISSKYYFVVFTLLGIFLGAVLCIEVDTRISLHLVRKEEEIYQTYLLEEQLEKIPTKGVLFVGKEKCHYERQTEDKPVAYQDLYYHLVSFSIKGECKDTVLSGKIQISKNTILQRLFDLWKEEA